MNICVRLDPERERGFRGGHQVILAQNEREQPQVRAKESLISAGHLAAYYVLFYRGYKLATLSTKQG